MHGTYVGSELIIGLLDTIHGDIKPQNILVFRNDDGSWTGRVADFGFSSIGDQVVLPKSWPWYAPEWDEYPEFTFQQAIKSEIFSFGMVCLWIVFENVLSSFPSLSEGAKSTRVGRSENDLQSTLKLLADLKSKDALGSLATRLVMQESEQGRLGCEAIPRLETFFSRCLAHDPALRAIYLDDVLSSIDIGLPPTTNPKPLPNTRTMPSRFAVGKDASQNHQFNVRSPKMGAIF